jgi:hypothetical protein
VDVHGSMSLTTVARILERLGDHAERISRQAIEQAEEPKDAVQGKAMRSISDRSMEILSRSISAFFLHDVTAANLVIDQARDLVKEGEDLLPKLMGGGGKGTMSRTAVMNSLERTIMYATDIAEIAINDAMRLEMRPKTKEK